jgi:Na+-translocating ferredoxin:NAD+ oxidoreductase RNF subunit RnfB
MARYSYVFSALIATAVAADGAAYAQCGGNGFTGATTCVSGYTCQYQNDYYSQCVPGSAAVTTKAAAPTKAAATTLMTVRSSGRLHSSTETRAWY